MPKMADRVKQSTTTTGTGAVALTGSITGFRDFSAAFSSGDSVYYCVSDANNWEVGIGTYTGGGTPSVSRDSVLSSSNNNALVNFPAGTKEVFSTAPAASLRKPGVFRAMYVKSADFTVVNADDGAIFSCTSSLTISLDTAASLGSGFSIGVKASSASTVTIDPNGSESIDGMTTYRLSPLQSCIIACDGSAFHVISGDGVGYTPGFGYLFGGTMSGGTKTNAINKIAFGTTDTGSAISATLATARSDAAAGNSLSKGYVFGGTGTGGGLSSIEGITFNNEAISGVSAVISTSRSSSACLNSSSSAFIAGGYNGGTLSSIEALSFDNESRRSVSATLSSGRHEGSGVSFSDRGYVGGGTGYATSLERFMWSAEAVSTITATLDAGRVAGTSYNSATKGYFVGGVTNGSVYTASIEDVNKSTETSATITAGLGSQRGYFLGGCNSILHGYSAGGTAGSYVSAIDRLAWSDETRTVSAASLSAALTSEGQGGCQSGGLL